VSFFQPDFTEFIECLNKTNVEYLIVGGYATIIHGYNRTTGDLDIWVNQTDINYDKILGAFNLFQMPIFDMSKENFMVNPDIDVFSFGRPPVCIDIITRLKGLNFEEAYVNVEKIKVGNLRINVISLDDLIKAKSAANRPKDQDDIDHLRGK